MAKKMIKLIMLLIGVGSVFAATPKKQNSVLSKTKKEILVVESKKQEGPSSQIPALGNIDDDRNQDFFSLSTTMTWKEYVLCVPRISFSKEKWTWAGSITLKSRNPVKLTMLVLQWRGDALDQIAASLYQKKERETVVIPIQKNLVCDGVWDKDKQQIVFSLNEKIVAVNKYHLVLSYPKDIESKVRHGKFVVANTAMSYMHTAK